MNEKEKNDGRFFHVLQPTRDLESNWAVDVAKELGSYLLDICSNGDFRDQIHGSVNFAEAALLLQGSTQVYSRKVEYLYNLVLHALEFISQKRQDQQENTSFLPNGTDADAVAGEENEEFLSLDGVPVEPKIDLVGESNEDTLNHFVKPPANLLVLEGDCIDAAGDGGELESYLLATSSLYNDFLLLDPCDVVAINNLKVNYNAGHTRVHRGSSVRSKCQKSFGQSPSRKSRTILHKSCLGKNHDNPNNSPCRVDIDIGAEPPEIQDFPEDNYDGGDMFAGCSEQGDDSDDYPWMPLNPYEPGNLKVKPFKKGKFFERKVRISTQPNFITSQFPLARLHDTIRSEFADVMAAQFHARTKERKSQSSSSYEKLRQSLIFTGDATPCFGDLGKDYGFEDDAHEFEEADDGLPKDTYMDTENVHNFNVDAYEDFEHEDMNAHASLEDLCRSHLDALLANIAEVEKQTELATHVSTWKQRIEHSLEEQDSRPPFDIHAYGEKVINKLSLESDNEGSMSFTDIVRGQEKHEIARTFTALLQLVNNGNVALDREVSSGESICFSAVNPFYVRLLSNKKREEEILSRKVPFVTGNLCSSKRSNPNSPNKSKNTYRGSQLPVISSPFTKTTSTSTSPHSKNNFSVRLGKSNGIRCTPEGKRRRRSGLIKPMDVESARGCALGPPVFRLSARICSFGEFLVCIFGQCIVLVCC